MSTRETTPAKAAPAASALAHTNRANANLTKAAQVQAAVCGWYATTARDLPWRRPECTPWGVLVSEVMLQQTPVARVEPVWRAWMRDWPTPGALASAPVADVLRAWGRLGYPRRALRLHECAQAIVDRHDGGVPRGTGELRALPGVGEYTAAAVAAFAFGDRCAVVDTNVARVLTRLFAATALPHPSGLARERRLAQDVLPTGPAQAAMWAAASMELGALVCTARAPQCADCPVAPLCAWRGAGFPPDEFAARRRSQPWAGTDRQVRGRVMAALRAQDQLTEAEISTLWADSNQRQRCLASLLHDGLIECLDGAYRLPRAASGRDKPSAEARGAASADGV